MWYVHHGRLSYASDDYGYGYGGIEDGPDRRNWAEKSQAAIQREDRAKTLFARFLERSKQEAPSAFPLTQDVVPALVHLTEACYKAFREFVISKGCKVKRRLATEAEKDPNRRGKSYVISVTIPVHPRQLEQKKQEDKAKAIEAANKKKEREQAKQQREKEQAILRQKQQEAYDLAVQNAYNKIVGAAAEEQTKTTKTTTTTEKAVAVGNGCNSENEPPIVNVKSVQKTDLVLHAEKVHKSKIFKIKIDLISEKSKREAKLEKQMDDKKRRLVKEASSDLERIKKSILQYQSHQEEVTKNKNPTTSSSTATAAAPNHK